VNDEADDLNGLRVPSCDELEPLAVSDDEKDYEKEERFGVPSELPLCSGKFKPNKAARRRGRLAASLAAEAEAENEKVQARDAALLSLAEAVRDGLFATLVGKKDKEAARRHILLGGTVAEAVEDKGRSWSPAMTEVEAKAVALFIAREVRKTLT
jgi:hypothetical protein